MIRRGGRPPAAGLRRPSAATIGPMPGLGVDEVVQAGDEGLLRPDAVVDGLRETPAASAMSRTLVGRSRARRTGGGRRGGSPPCRAAPGVRRRLGGVSGMALRSFT